ncbi:helix-turn-helix domain-containing protein [Ornithinicoccus hortensis]|uniref:Regulatory LuxR family protein n=1 Tax=Ornithinicoccus hortensis TaxID=82346 RepID=A0A542YU09_9MICO|nr:helix-turn-helix transcriptional regulator [Ornithinicoccus hortensis]TQL51444.1 regulatory LuxR family protein [Ornithinicoccus hortensis]
MAAITVRSLDEDVRRRLKVRAARNNRSMEAEVRAILAAAAAEEDRPEQAATGPEAPAQGRITLVLQASGLTPRERVVAGYIAQGWTNRQIAVHLYLSERTVESHVGSVLRKLGYRSRAGVAAWHAAMSGGLGPQEPG